MRRQWTPREIHEVVTRYPVDGAVALATKLSRSPNSISSKARRYGVRSGSRRIRQAETRATQSPTVNAQFFDETNPQVARAVGFLWACGSIKTRHRQVLRLSCESDRTENLKSVLALLDCHHQIQRRGHRAVVEIGNSRLVQSLIDRFGTPPRPADNQAAIPELASWLMPSFAQGHLDATGFESLILIRWTGHSQVMRKLLAHIQSAVVVSEPKFNRLGRNLNMAWTDQKDVDRIREWLKIHPAA